MRQPYGFDDEQTLHGQLDPVGVPGNSPGPTSRSLVGAVVVSLLFGLAGVGIGVAALLSGPAKVVGPTGPRGLQGLTGAQGPAGPVGAVGPTGPQGAAGSRGATGQRGGATGPAGPPGTIVGSTIDSGSTVSSAPQPAVGTEVTATTSCPSGTVLLDGGAQVSAPGATGGRNVELRTSFPLNNTTWHTVGLVTGPVPQGSMTMKPFVVCGKP